MKQILLFFSIFTCTAVQSQEKLKLFIDCQNAAFCDFNYIREQVPVVDFVRDRLESDVHVLITMQTAGNGGKRYTVLLLGQKQWAAYSDTLHYTSGATNTQDEVRQHLAKLVASGIVPYLLKKGNADLINVSFGTKDINPGSKTKDPWNYWNFRIGGNAYFSGDNNYRQKSISANAFAGRITDDSKIEFFVYKSTEKNRYTITDNNDQYYLSTLNDYMEFEQSYVKSMGPKWSWALQSEYRSSTYDNVKSQVSVAAGFEYNLFPYKASNTRFLTLRYMIGATGRSYFEETIYGRKKESLLSNDIGLYISFTKPWGNISSAITWYNYLHDFSKNNLSVNTNMQLQLFKGISLNFYVYGSIINDQLSVPKGAATQEEILLKLRALSTSYNYSTGIGINYRFGSKFNNYVNPRFTNGRN
jgi:hypothetical protein